MKTTKLLFLLSFIFLTACGRKQEKEFRIDPSTQIYYDMFLSAGKIRGQNLSTDDLIIEVKSFVGDSDAGDAAGYCKKGMKESLRDGVVYYKSTPYVALDVETWNRVNDYGKRHLLFHELGHCLLNLEHDTSMNSLGYVKSFMYPSFFYGYYGSLYPYLEPSLVDQLFIPSSQPSDPYGIQPIIWAP